jgi:hypothetical protein
MSEMKGAVMSRFGAVFWSAMIWWAMAGGVASAKAAELDPDLYLEFFNYSPAAYDDDWTADDRRMVLRRKDGQESAEYTWSDLPKRIDPGGFSLKLTASATSKKAYVSAGLKANGGNHEFTFDPGTEWDGAMVQLEIKGPGKKSNTVVAKVKPNGPLQVGQAVDLFITASGGSVVAYRYFVKSRDF